ncbi:MAG: hypothetical protein LBQ06_05030 [Frankiaceae bacterium]|jgi:hypothetical protein|nr:hypothetical protein [Frankiaceae bacterium]
MFDGYLWAAWLWSGINRLRGEDSERGDVPGWVMVTVMTAALVVALLALFRGRIVDIVNNALDSVTGEAAKN